MSRKSPGTFKNEIKNLRTAWELNRYHTTYTDLTFLNTLRYEDHTAVLGHKCAEVITSVLTSATSKMFMSRYEEDTKQILLGSTGQKCFG